MKIYRKKAILDGLKKLKKIEFHWVFSANILLKLTGFVSVVILAHILSKDEMGVIGYSEATIRFVMPFFGGGIYYGVLVFGSRYKNHLREISTFAIKYASIINSTMLLLIFPVILLIPFPFERVRWVILGLVGANIFKSYREICFSIIRTKKDNKSYSLYLIVSSVLLLSFVVFFSYFFRLKGYIAARILVPLIISFVLFVKMKDYFNFSREGKYRGNRKELISLSLISVISSLLSSLLYSIDTFLVGNILRSETLTSAYYIGTIIPHNLTFIPITLLTTLFPYIAENASNTEWIRRNYYKALKVMLLMGLLISAFSQVFARQIIEVCFGVIYLDSIKVFRILMGAFVFSSSFRIVSGNYLAAMGKVKYNVIISSISCLFNVILNIILIKKYSIEGAALATASVFILGGFLGFFFMIKSIRETKKDPYLKTKEMD